MVGKYTLLFLINVLPGANFVGSNSVGMNGAPTGGPVGDSMMGPGKAGGLVMGAACRTGGTWKTKKHKGIMVRLRKNKQESAHEAANWKKKPYEHLRIPPHKVASLIASYVYLFFTFHEQTHCWIIVFVQSL